MKSKFFFILIIILHSELAAQFDPGFIRHLSALGVKAEHQAYIESVDPGLKSDSAHYYLGKFHLQYQQDSLFLFHWNKGKSLFGADTGFVNLAFVHFLAARDEWREGWYSQNEAMPVGRAAKSCLMIYKLGIDPFMKFPEELPMDDRMLMSLSKYQKIYKRKPWKGALLSTVVPGLGKYYAGRSKAGFLGFAGTLMFGLQAWESNRKLGIKHPLTIINLSVLGLFYGANIYGGALEVRRVKMERKNQFYKYASRYYHSYYKCRLY